MDLFDQIIISEDGKNKKARHEEMSKTSSGTTFGKNPKHLLDGLNTEQMQAVQHDHGPLLILAGAGSGKTRVITHRIAWLIIEKQVSPYAILAITFTNKAAAEMKSRIESLIGSVSHSMWVGTFHAMMMRILRRYAERIGYERNFTILDSDDQLKVVKACLKQLRFDERLMTPKNVHSQISSAKNALIAPDTYASQAGSDFRRSKVAEVYQMYQQRLKQSNSMDFDDILFESVRLLRDHKDVLEEYQNRFRYILVDEYQDTNHAQYQLVHMLSAASQNLCVVGDDDQSIYSFRGANIQNILDFEKDFKRCKVIKLEQNYRSTQTILNAANQVIKENTGRKPKALWTEHGKGDKITFYRADDQNDESRYIAREIDRLVNSDDFRYGDMAILYRVNALSRNLEAALREQGIPYRIFGGTRFYDRKEVKDVLAYLRLIASSRDEIAFSRIINVPRRGIGDVTMQQIAVLAAREKISQFEVCGNAGQYPELQRASTRLTAFADLIQTMRDWLLEDNLTFAAYIEKVEHETGLIQELIDQQDRSRKDDPVDRIENLKELISDALEFELNLNQRQDLPESEKQPEDEDLDQVHDLQGMMRAYLERAALYADMDQESGSQDYVRLLTIHSAKGLEFKTVFLVGTEEGLFPGFRARDSESDMEEERRLAYVAITRAERKLYITTARSRLVFGQTMSMPVSHFIQGIDDDYIEEIGGSRRPEQRYGSDTGYGSRSGEPYDKRGYSSSRPSGTDASEKPFSPPKRHVFPGAESHQQKKYRAMPTTQSSVDPSVYKAGLTVRHAKFGTGKVISALPVAGDAILQIEFDKGGKKRLMAKMAGLEVLI